MRSSEVRYSYCIYIGAELVYTRKLCFAPKQNCNLKLFKIFFQSLSQMSQKWDRKIVLTLNARNEHDRSKFVEDLRESVAEMDEMEALRLEAGNFINTSLLGIAVLYLYSWLVRKVTKPEFLYKKSDRLLKEVSEILLT